MYITKQHSPNVTNIKHNPTIMTDHYNLVKTKLKLGNLDRGPGYWHFNNNLLNNDTYTTTVPLWWKNWQPQRSKFPSIKEWWKQGKSYLKNLTIRYASDLSKNKKRQKDTSKNPYEITLTHPSLMKFKLTL